MKKSSSAPSRREFLAGAAAATATALTGCGGQAPPPIPGPRAIRRPNILFLFSDQHRGDWMGRNPEIPVPMPNIDRLAARGVDFTRAIVPSPVCGPSRACLASGMEYENCGVEVNRDNYPAQAKPTFYKHLRDGGYHTMAVGKIDLHKGPAGVSLDGRLHMEEWGFSDMLITGSKSGLYNGEGDPTRRNESTVIGPKEPYMAYLDSLDPPLGRIHADDIDLRAVPKDQNWWGMTDPTPLDDEAYKDNYTARTGLELIERVPDGMPWFSIVNFNGPHPPMDITRRMEAHYRGPDRVIENFPQPHHYTGPFTAEHHIRIRQNYAAMIENIDRWVGLCQERLEERGELDNTIVIYASDHGEMLGDHDLWGKSLPYQASAGVPLVMAGPGIATGVRSDALVSVMDLATTFLDYGEVAIPSEMDSRSLRPLLDSGGGQHRDYLRSALKTGNAATGRFRSVNDHRYKLVEGFFEEKALYDLEADPLETENIAASKPSEVARLERLFA